MSKILISYRRDDSADVSGRIYDRLVQQFGKVAVFKDVDSIPLGVDFRFHLDEQVAKCDVFLAVIGPDWIGVRNSVGKPKLEDPKDFVRIEIESALKRKIPVIPILVRGASVPSIKQLPESLQNLSYRHGLPIRSDPDFHHDMTRLIEHLKAVFEMAEPAGRVQEVHAQESIRERRAMAEEARSRSEHMVHDSAHVVEVNKPAALSQADGTRTAQGNFEAPQAIDLEKLPKSFPWNAQHPALPKAPPSPDIQSLLLNLTTLWLSHIRSRQGKTLGIIGSVIVVILLIFFAVSSPFLVESSKLQQKSCPFGGDLKDERCVVLPADSETTLFFDQNSVYFRKARSNDCGSSELKNMKITKDPRTGICKIEFDQQVPRLTISSAEEVFYYPSHDMGKRQPGVDLYGYDYRSFESKDIDFCEQACSTDPLCRAFALGPKPIERDSTFQTYYCWLKSEINETPKKLPRVTSGVKQR